MTQPSATVVSLKPVICWPWHIRLLGPDNYIHGANCTYCGRDVAAPPGIRLLICLYCGMERGLVPLVERDGYTGPREPWEREPEILDLFGVYGGDDA